jgi:parvulin-like peptidyl-prolyl isomerase
MIKTKNIIIFLSIFLSIFSYIFGAEKFSNKVIVKVGKDSILLSDFEGIANPIIDQYKQLNPNFLENDGEKKLKDNILEQMIDEKVILQEAKNKKINVSKRKIDKSLEEVKDRFKTEDEFKNELKKLNMSEAQFTKKLTDQLVIMEVINTEIKSKVNVPSDEEARKYYNEHEAEMVDPAVVRVRHILMRTDGKNDAEVLKKMRSLKAKIDKDKKTDFAEYARKNSEDKTSAERGGDLGLFPRGQMLKEFEDAAFALNVGQVSNVIKTSVGYHIIKSEEKKLEQKKSFDEVKEHIKQYLYQIEMDKEIKKWLDNAKKNIKIVKNDF